MIGAIRGNVIAMFSDHAIIMTASGLAYDIYLSSVEKSYVQNHLKDVLLWIYDDHKETGVSMYGFIDIERKTWFESLITLNGIGCKMAINILSTMTIDMLVKAIRDKDDLQIRKVPGIGSKIATRIVNELIDAQQKVMLITNGCQIFDEFGQQKVIMHSLENNTNIIQDAVDALVSLGFSRVRAILAVESASKDPEKQKNVQNLITASLAVLRES